MQIFHEKLSDRHNRDRFQSGQAELDNYLKNNAGQDAKRDLSSVFVLATLDCEIIGFYTLSQSNLAVDELPENFARKLPRNRLVPCTLLGRLAVDERYQGKGYGRDLLFYAMQKAAKISEEVASHAVIVDAKNENAKRFYQKYSFIELPSLPMRFFITVKAVRQLVKHWEVELIKEDNTDG